MNSERIKEVVDEPQSLSEREKIVLMLHYFENLNKQDISALLHLEEKRVEQIINEIRMKQRIHIFTTLMQKNMKDNNNSTD